MVNSVSSTPYTYYNQLNPKAPAPAPAAVAAVAPKPAPVPVTSISPSLSPDVVSVLQQFNSPNALGGLYGNKNDAQSTLDGAFFNLLLGAAYQSKPQTASTQTSAVQSAIAQYQKAANAYGAPSSKDAVAANSFQADGKTPLKV